VLSLLEEKGFDVSEVAQAIEGKFMSAFIRARKPAG